MTKRAILYARVSGDDRKYATSGIDSQLTDCRRYATERGYQVVGEVFETPDKVTSGADWLPELDRVLKLAQSGGFDVLVVREIDRLARNRFKQMSVEIQLESCGARVEYVIGQFEESAEGRLLKGLMSEFAEYEREKIRERTRRGKLNSVAAGNVTTGGSYAPYGYDLVKVNGRRVLVVNEEEAAIVRLIFDLYANHHYSRYRIRDHLDALHIPKPAKGNNHKAHIKTTITSWSPGTIGGIIDNECYVGRWHFRKTKPVKDPATGKRHHVPRHRDEWIEISVPAVVEESVFEAAQSRRTTNKRLAGHQRRYHYLLGGMLTCGHCGNSMTGNTRLSRGKEYPYYKCNAYHSPKNYGFKCDNTPYRVGIVDKHVWRFVKGLYTSPETLDRALAEYQAQQADAQRPQLELIEATAARLADAEREKARLVKAYASGVLTLEEIATTKTELDRRLNDLTQVLATLRAELPAAVLSQDAIDRIKRDAAELRAGVASADCDPAKQRRILEQILVKCSLVTEGGKRYADVDTILGAKRLPMENVTTCSTVHRCTLRARLPLDGDGAGELAGAFFAAVTMVNA